MGSLDSTFHSEEYEATHVHAVYEEIASHFSSTRYKPWPLVTKFLDDQAPGAVGVDIGCGNGKYLGINPSVFIVGSDRSSNLSSIARQLQPESEAIVADILSLPHPLSSFDFALSIAVLHHLSTRERRAEAVRRILELLRPTENDTYPRATALLYVWALEQKNSRRGWSEGDSQDVMVPWVRRAAPSSSGESTTAEQTFQRYYHLYKKGELEEDVVEAGGRVVDSGYERDNWWAIVSR